jgi:hypothetical protein
MDGQMKKYAPWIGVALLVIIVLVLLQRFRSKYTPPPGAVITMMDLQEFSAFSPEQKSKYASALEFYNPRLVAAASSNSVTTYQMLLKEIMTNALMPPPPPPMPPPPPPPPPSMPAPPPSMPAPPVM